MSKYYGESERLLGKVFSLANELSSGAIIFLDEVTEDFFVYSKMAFYVFPAIDYSILFASFLFFLLYAECSNFNIFLFGKCSIS